MSDIAILKQMIKETATVPLENHYNKKKVILREPPPANYSVTIHGMPEDNEVIIIKADNFNLAYEVFQGKKHECKRADFVIIANTETQKVIVCIEMKAGKGGLEEEIIQQLKGAQCFVAYCREIGQLFWNNRNFLKGYKYRFISIKNISVSKKPSRTKTAIHDRPERMLKISSPKHLEFNHLI
ncbi:conserved hypothetical protein [Planktothrix serta PCC 8927]|uniref:Uncharacterized protein n=1 Tax=Planktothrix serta PCC 8927 TaxID=671068 RepID=A0A7Z9E095_9CYAN|nr:hypothetical protein [Planktothrix serta]VXD16045.1 conserved hypothetical protein [Planktothrix serta PCC 8927]